MVRQSMSARTRSPVAVGAQTSRSPVRPSGSISLTLMPRSMDLSMLASMDLLRLWVMISPRMA